MAFTKPRERCCPLTEWMSADRHTLFPLLVLGYFVFTFQNPYLGNTCVPFQHWTCSKDCALQVEVGCGVGFTYGNATLLTFCHAFTEPHLGWLCSRCSIIKYVTLKNTYYQTYMVMPESYCRFQHASIKYCRQDSSRDCITCMCVRITDHTL